MSADLVDARRARTVTVTEPDRVAEQCSPTHCPIANAIRRAWRVDDVRVGAGVVYTTRRGVRTRWQIEPNARAMIRAYDEAGQAMPAGVTIRLEPPVRPLGSRAGTRPGSDRRSGAGRSPVTRRPSTRHVLVDPPA